MDIVKAAQNRLERLNAEKAKLESFLHTALELQSDLVRHNVERPVVTAGRSEVNPRMRVGERKPPKSGAIYDTAMAARDYMLANGDGRKTRDLLPVIQERGIEIGGVNLVATLSARLSQSMMLELKEGKWFILPNAVEKTADSPSKDTSAASLFSNQGDA